MMVHLRNDVGKPYASRLFCYDFDLSTPDGRPQHSLITHNGVLSARTKSNLAVLSLARIKEWYCKRGQLKLASPICAKLENSPWSVHVYDIKSLLQGMLDRWSRIFEVETVTMQATKSGDGTELRCEGADGLQTITNKATQNL